MRMRSFIVLLPLAVAIQSIEGQVAPPIDRANVTALTAALEHVRRDFPDGPVVLKLNEKLSPDVRESLAAALGVPVRRSDDLTECYQPVKGAQACRFVGGVVGALEVTSVQLLADGRYRAIVSTTVQMSGTHRESWLYWRQYEVELAPVAEKWVVVGSKLLTRS